MIDSPNLEHKTVKESGKQDCVPKADTPYYSRYDVSTYAMSASNQAVTSGFIRNMSTTYFWSTLMSPVHSQSYQ